MASTTLISVSEYLATSYRPDCDYVDGEVQERNVGEREHALLQAIFTAIFNNNRKTWNLLALPEQHVQVGNTRYRIPDVCVILKSDPVEPIVRTAPLICIEILSPEDRLQRVQERVDDYLQMGVGHIWIIDPKTRHAYIASNAGFQAPANGELVVPHTPIRIVLADVFAEFDEMQTQG